MKRLLIVLFLFAAVGAAYAHNGMEHVMGSIAAISTGNLQVKATTGKMTTVVLNASTRWMRGANAIDPSDAKVGERVVVHAKPVDGKLIAAEVEVSANRGK